MGCSASVEVAEEDNRASTPTEEEESDDENRIKILLLGAGESGKSTVAKQVKIIYLSGFNSEELKSYRPIVHNNTLVSIKALVNGAKAFNNEFLPENQEAAEHYMQLQTTNIFVNPIMADDITRLWQDPAVQKTFLRANELQLPDVAEYCFEHIDRIAAPDYIPTTDDAVRCRARTTGIVEMQITIDGVNFVLVDVGGQRSERKKWIHCFQNVTAVLFCFALNEYDMKLWENDSINRMHEAISLYSDITNSKWFINTPTIIFMNKRDLFEEKIKNVDLNVCFPEYTGGCDYDRAIGFITSRLLSLSQNPDKSLYTHVTCATDTENVRFCFNAARDAIISLSLNGGDLF